MIRFLVLILLLSIIYSSQQTNSTITKPSSQPSLQPSRQPTSQPSRQPSCQPTRQPTSQPSSKPSSQPSLQPTLQPSSQPSSQPTSEPTTQPTLQPSSEPSRQPTAQPSCQPSRQPSSQPSRQPSSQPSSQPSRQPSCQPSCQPSYQPSSKPSRQPSSQPSRQPSSQPSCQPTSQPSCQPSSQPSYQPTSQPSRQPSSQPSSQPTIQPSSQPSRQPSSQPSSQPSGPSSQPSSLPSSQPTSQPSRQPSCQPTRQPSCQPTSQPTRQPTSQPSSKPSRQPTSQPSLQPTSQPSLQPSCQPTSQPSSKPSGPSHQPTSQPSSQPSCKPSLQPSSQPTLEPTSQPSSEPSSKPSGPSNQPTSEPTSKPSSQPSPQPTLEPTSLPSSQPSSKPSTSPPSHSHAPTGQPTSRPSRLPSSQPSTQPTLQPTGDPSRQPTSQPSSQPSSQPTSQPSSKPSSQPSSQPTSMPTLALQASIKFSVTQKINDCDINSWSDEISSNFIEALQSAVTLLKTATIDIITIESGRRQLSNSVRILQSSLLVTYEVKSSTQNLRMSNTSLAVSTIINSINNSTIDGFDAERPSLVPGSLTVIIHRSARPSGQPSSQPTRQPSSQPSSQPTSPTSQPSSQPSKLHYINDGDINVFISFGVLGVFIILITVLADNYHGSVRLFGLKKIENFKKNEEVLDSDSDSGNDGDPMSKLGNDSPRKAFEQVLISQLKLLFDGIFAVSDSKKTVIEKEFEENHLYFSLLYSKKVGLMRWFKAFKLFTSETVAAAFICLFYSYQSPRSSIYSCHQYNSASLCLKNKSVLDSTKSVCQWRYNTCSLNNSSSYYDHIAFIIILTVVMQAMSIVNFILDISINHIICAPAYAEEDDLKRAIDRDDIRSQSGKIVQEKMLRMMHSMKSYRKFLYDNFKTEELSYFDDQWGVTESLSESSTHSPRRRKKHDDDSSRMTTSLSTLKKKFNIRDSERIAKDMFEIVSLTQEYSFRLQDHHGHDSSLLLLYIFVLDLLGRNSPIAKIYAKKVDLFTLHKPKVPLAIKFIVFLILLASNGAAIYFTSIIAAKQDLTWNYVVLVCACAYLFFDMVVFETAKLFWIHLMIPSLITPFTANTEKTILSLMDKSEESLMEEDDEEVKTFNASDYVFVSVATAKLFPQKPESGLILSYKSMYPENYWATWRGIWWQKVLSYGYTKPSWETLSSCQKLTSCMFFWVRPVRNLVKRILITFGSYFSIEVQGFIIHGAQPGIIYAVVYGAYAVEQKLRIGLYALVGGMLLILLLIPISMCTLYGNKVAPDDDKEDEEEDEDDDDDENDLSSLEDDSLSITNNNSNTIGIEPSRSLTSIATYDDIRSAVSTNNNNNNNNNNKINEKRKENVSFYQYLFGKKKKSQSVQPDNNDSRPQHFSAQQRSHHPRQVSPYHHQHQAHPYNGSYDHEQNYHDHYNDPQQYYSNNQVYYDQHSDNNNQQYYDNTQHYYDTNQQYYGHNDQHYYDHNNQQYYDNNQQHYGNAQANDNTIARVRNNRDDRFDKRARADASKKARKAGFGPYH